jgi:hypothetical protein
MFESSLPPISGGGPEAYEPSPEDWREYFDHFDRADAMAMPREAARAERLSIYAQTVRDYHASR